LACLSWTFGFELVLFCSFSILFNYFHNCNSMISVSMRMLYIIFHKSPVDLLFFCILCATMITCNSLLSLHQGRTLILEPGCTCSCSSL
jgi:hypothetical protein